VLPREELITLTQPISINGKELESVTKFTYLGNELEEVGDVETDVNSIAGQSGRSVSATK